MAWVEMVNTELGSYLTIDIVVNKVSAGQIGVNFKQEFIPDKYQVSIFFSFVIKYFDKSKMLKIFFKCCFLCLLSFFHKLTSLLSTMNRVNLL